MALPQKLNVDNQPGKSGTLASMAVRQAETAIRSRPGELRYSTSSSGTILNFAAQYLMSIAGMPINAASALHFDGWREAVAATVGPLIRNGKLRGLFTTASGRMESFPEVPNAREAGYRGMSSIVGWSALMGSPGLPDAVVQYWKQALQKMAAEPQWLADNARLGAQPAIRLIARRDPYVQDQAALYQRMALSMKVKP